MYFGNMKSKTQSKNREFECKMCSGVYTSEKRLREHKCRYCATCEKLFSSYQRLKQHQSKGSCSLKTLQNMNNDLNEQKCHPDRASFKCEWCGTVYTSENRLRQHKCKYCKDCQQSFSTYQRFKQHTCSGQRLCEPVSSNQLSEEKCAPQLTSSFKCDLCGSSYTSENRLKNHKCKYCKNCDILFSTYQRQQQHICKHLPVPCSSSTTETYHFVPVDLTWQLRKSSLFSIHVLEASVPLFVENDYIIAGCPLNTKPTIGDGNCFFRAVSLVLSGTQDNHLRLRNITVDHILKLGNKLSFFLPVNTTAESYINISKMRENRVWATDVEIHTTAHLLQTDIYIYSQFGHNFKWMKHSGTFIDPALIVDNRAIYLNHTNGNHYDVVTSVLNEQRTTRTPKLMTTSVSNSLSNSIKDVTNEQATRRQYFQTYKQKQRRDLNFRNKENILHQKHRSNIEVREMERVKEKEERKKRRSDPEIRIIERLKEKESQKKRRIDPIVRIGERIKDKELHKRRRIDSEVRERERLKDNELRKKRRIDPEVRERERLKEKEVQRKRRIDAEVREKERIKDNELRKKRRIDPEVRERERLKEKEVQRKRRIDAEVREKERIKDNELHKKRRTDPYVRVEERIREKEVHRRRRTDPGVRVQERIGEKELHSRRRVDVEFRERECIKDKELHRRRRIDPNIRVGERIKEKELHRRRRIDPNIRVGERIKEKELHRRRRIDPNIRVGERIREKEVHRRRRTDPHVRKEERFKEKEVHRRRRTDPHVRIEERIKEKEVHRRRRTDPGIRKIERMKAIKLKRKKRENSVVRNIEKVKDKIARRNSRQHIKNTKTLDTVVSNFHENLKRGDDFTCTCCGQTFYQHSVYAVIQSNYQKKNISQQLLNKCLTGIKSCSDTEWICKTCHKYILKDRLPPMALANGFYLPEIPDIINKWKPTPTEERCCALRIPFMQLKELGIGKQFGIFGNTVNVPMNPSQVVQVLPRRFEETETIQLQFMRRLKFKRPVMFETVRPKVIYNVTKYFVENSDIYKEEGVKLTEEWIADTDDQNEVVFNTDKEEVTTVDPNNDENNNEIGEEKKDEDDDWSELNEQELYGSGNKDTLLQPCDFTDDGRHILRIAPGEGSTPISLYLDKDAEEKSFPILFAGNRRKSNSERSFPVTYGSICKSELRNADRRFATSVPNIFFKLKKLQMLQVRDMAMTALRKTKGKQDLTAGALKKPETLINLIRHDEGYTILKSLRSSPPYLQSKQKDLFALIRQLGIPTFFATFSAAETRWTDLLGVLAKKFYGRPLSESEMTNLTWMQNCELIQKDPVTCARHFQYRTHLFFHNILLSPVSPIGVLIDYDYRVEFQQRGSPHLHCLFWTENAPVYGVSSDEEVLEFIDKYISCSANPDGKAGEFIPLQTHKHSRSCKKMGRKVCRFGFPIPPMRKTCILDPLPSETSAADMLAHKQSFSKIQAVLNDSTVPTMSFDDFLNKCGLDEDAYMSAVRSSIKKKKIFLKRLPSEVRINAYNPDVLSIWQANTDIQFVLDPYAICAYIASYMMKSQRGISMLLQNAIEEVKRGNHSIKERIRVITSKFLNHCEVTAQEAIYLLLQMPLTQASRDVIFINTSPPEKRVSILKPKAVLDNLPEDCTEVTCDGLIERYANRPRQLENITLAEFAANYERRPRPQKRRKEDADKIDNTDNPVEDISGSPELILPNGDILVKRRKEKVIRYVNFNKEKEPELFYREKLVLFFPWRNEDTIMGDAKSYQEKYEQLTQKVADNLKQYDKLGEELDAAFDEIEEEDLLSAVDTIAPSARQSEEDGLANKTDAESFGFLQPTSDENANYDFGVEIGCGNSVLQQTVMPNRMTSDEYFAAVRNLNTQQKAFFMHVLHLVKTSKDPFQIFLSGGAGVGKSFLLKVLYQALLRYYDTIPGEDQEQVKVILTAPTGKAAYNIRGSTLHSMFAIPANHSLAEYQHLDNSRLNTLRTRFAKLQIVVIDEISMVGSNMFNFIDQRLQQVFGVKKPFGGVSLLLVGDLFQLRPVMDKWIFQVPDSPYDVLAPSQWNDHISLFELTEIMRQKEDGEFAAALNRIREGNITEKDRVDFKQRVITRSSPCYPKDALHLFTNNEKVDEHNSEVIQKLQTEGCSVRAKDFIIGNVPSEKIDVILEEARNLPTQKTQNLRQVLHIKVNGQYMLSHNIDTSDGLTNGAMCTIKHFDTVPPNIIWVKFEDNDIGLQCRKSKKTLYSKKDDPNWTPLVTVEKQFQVSRNKEIQVMRRQFPLQPSAALTIHKSQGSSLTEAVVSFSGKRAPGPHMMYVALSRVTHIEGLHLLDFNPNNIKVDPLVVAEMDRLRKERTVKSLQSPLLDTTNSNLKIVCNNARSLHSHILDIQNDFQLRACDILIILETWLKNEDDTDDYLVEGFQHNLRKDAPCGKGDSRPHGGMLVYSNFPLSNCKEYLDKKTQLLTFNVSVKEGSTTTVMALYRHSTTTTAQLLQLLVSAFNCLPPSQPVILLGDFNLDAFETNNTTRTFIHTLLQKFQLKLYLEKETTDYHSCIDHVYSTLNDCKTGVLETYWSDHKAVWLTTQL